MRACQSGAISAFVGARASRDCSTDAATLQKLSPAFTTQVSGLDAGAVGAGGAGDGTVVGGGGGAVVVVGGAVVVVVVDGGAVVVVVVDVVVVLVVVSVAGGMADAGGPGVGPIVGTVVVVRRNGAVVEGAPELEAGAEPDAPAPRSATDDPPPHAATIVTSAPTHSNLRRLRFTGGEPTCGWRYLAKTRRNSSSPLLPTLAGPPEGLSMS